MTYAIRNDGQGLRAVNSEDDCTADEFFSENLPIPTAAQLLASAQAAQIAILDAYYAQAVQASVTFTTAAGVTKTYQADNQGPLSSQSVLLKAFTGFNIGGVTPDGFCWKSEDNTKVPFTLSDLGGLYVAMLAQGNDAFNKRETLKAAVRAATKVSTVQAIVWQ